MAALRTKHQWAFKAAAVVLFALAFVFFEDLAWQYVRAIDFNIYYYGAVLESHGHSYTNTNAVVSLAMSSHASTPTGGVWGTPVLVALVFEPLTLISRHQAFFVWQLATALVLFASLRKAAGNRWPFIVIVAALSPTLWMAARLGNACVLTIALLAYTYGALRVGQDRRAGIALGLATAFKLFPGFLILALVATRRWRALAATLITGVLATAVSVPIVGWHNFFLALNQSLAAGQLDYAWTTNASVPGVLFWIVGSRFTLIINLFCLVGAAALVLKSSKFATHQVMAFGCVVMLLAQSVSWAIYFPLAILPVCALLELKLERVHVFVAAVAYITAVALPIVVIAWAQNLSPALGNTLGLAMLGFILFSRWHSNEPVAMAPG